VPNILQPSLSASDLCHCHEVGGHETSSIGNSGNVYQDQTILKKDLIFLHFIGRLKQKHIDNYCGINGKIKMKTSFSFPYISRLVEVK
jgi:hypothetical protein